LSRARAERDCPIQDVHEARKKHEESCLTLQGLIQGQALPLAEQALFEMGDFAAYATSVLARASSSAQPNMDALLAMRPCTRFLLVRRMPGQISTELLGGDVSAVNEAVAQARNVLEQVQGTLSLLDSERTACLAALAPLFQCPSTRGLMDGDHLF